jgi:ferric-dicitrate binding protein FerR (iron transport regulator)
LPDGAQNIILATCFISAVNIYSFYNTESRQGIHLMNAAEDIKFDEVGGARPQLLTWAKAIIIPAITLILVGSMAILIGRHRQKPVDWVNIHAVGRNRDLKLPDGSKVILREGSSVTYASDFGRNNRNLQLKGDAYFQVLNNPAFPFSIQTTHEIRTDASASFFISSSDTIERVVVEEGRVLVSKAPKSHSFMLLKTGERSEHLGNDLVRSSDVNQNYFAWQTHRLVFEHTPLLQAAKDIYHYFGVEIKFEGGIDANQLYLTSIYNNNTLDQVLQDIALKTGVVILSDGKMVVIRPAEKTPEMMKPDPKPGAAKKQAAIEKGKAIGKTDPISKKKKKKWWKFWGKK